MIHDADLDDAKFQRVECMGIDRVLKGWAKQGWLTKRFSVRASSVSTALRIPATPMNLQATPVELDRRTAIEFC